MWFIYLGISNTKVTHIVKVTKLLFLLTYPIKEHRFSCQTMQEARENSYLYLRGAYKSTWLLCAIEHVSS